MLDLVLQIYHSTIKAYYKASNEKRYINTCQENVDILEEIMEAEREDGLHKMHFPEEELSETRKKSPDTVELTRSNARRQITEMEDKVCEKFDEAQEMRIDIC